MEKGLFVFVCSNDVSHAMKRPVKDNNGFTCIRTSMTGFNFTHDVDEEFG